MRKILILTLILITLTGWGAKKYVTSTGSDSGNGTKQSPWATIYKAVQSTNVPDTIMIGSGLTITSACYVKPGVSVIGTGYAINCSGTSSNLVFGSQTVTDGNQTVEGLIMEGNMKGYSGIFVQNRNHVTIKNCTVRNFINQGITLYNPGVEIPPKISGCIVQDNQVINCSRYYAPGSGGALWITGQRDILIRGNRVINTFRSGDSTGFAFKSSYLMSALMDSNSFKIIGHDDNFRWAFAVEANNNCGGVEFSNDTIQGVFDIAGKRSTGVSVHGCVIGHPVLTRYIQTGIYLEANNEISDIRIYDNTIQNVCYALRFTPQYPGSIAQRIYIYNNTFSNIGILGVSNGYGIYSVGSSSTAIVRDVCIDDNIFIASTGNTQVTAISLPHSCIVSNFRIRNNLITGFENAPIITQGGYPKGRIDGLVIQDNVFYDNGNGNNPKWWGEIPTQITNTGNLKGGSVKFVY